MKSECHEAVESYMLYVERCNNKKSSDNLTLTMVDVQEEWGKYYVSFHGCTTLKIFASG